MKLDTAASLYSQQYEARNASDVDDDLANPYVGPRPFETAHKKLFFGRDQEAEMLLSFAIAERVMLFHAQSGAGKSSLVNAKLIPDLEAMDYFVLPRARVGLGDGAKQQNVANVFVFNALSSIVPGKIKSEALAQAQLSQYRAWLLPEQEDKPRWLIFDQFEEILTTNRDFWHQRDDFFKQTAAALSQDSLLSVIFVMRSDFGAGVEPYAQLLPGGLRTRFYMELPKRAAAMEAVQKPVLRFKCEFETDAAKELVNRLSLINTADGEKEGEYIEPVLLQVVCQQLWNRLAPKRTSGDTQITLDDVKEHAQVDAALRNFYEGAVETVAENQSNGEERIRDWFEQCLIVPPGIRGQVMREEPFSGELETELADKLVDAHIIRREEARGATWYELAHDRLIRPIKESNEAWLNLSENAYQRLALKWQESNYKDDTLLAAHELPAAEEWRQQNPLLVSARVRDFIQASLDKEADRQKEQKLSDEKLANKKLQEQKVELEIQREAIIKSTAEEIEALRAKAHRRKMNTYRVLVVAATVAAILIGIALYKVRQVQKLQASQDLAIAYIEKGEQAQRVIQQAHQEKAQAESISEHLKQRLQTLSEIYHLNLNSLDALEQDSSGANDEISAIEAEHKEKMAKDVEKRILVGVPLTVSDKGLTTLILGTELVQLRQIPSKENDASQETSVPRKIVFWRKDTPLWQAQYVAYILMRAGVKVKMIRECGSGPKENANASLPDEARDFNLCRWDDKNWAGLSVVVGWSSALPLKDNCALTVAQAKDKKSWAMCLDQSKNPGASVSPEELNP